MVSSAALIMVAVFSAFAALSLIDATIVRGILFPATLALLGGCAWYAPRRLCRPAPHGEPAGFPLLCTGDASASTFGGFGRTGLRLFGRCRRLARCRAGGAGRAGG